MSKKKPSIKDMLTDIAEYIDAVDEVIKNMSKKSDKIHTEVSKLSKKVKSSKKVLFRNFDITDLYNSGDEKEIKKTTEAIEQAKTVVAVTGLKSDDPVRSQEIEPIHMDLQFLKQIYRSNKKYLVTEACTDDQKVFLFPSQDSLIIKGVMASKDLVFLKEFIIKLKDKYSKKTHQRYVKYLSEGKITSILNSLKRR